LPVSHIQRAPLWLTGLPLFHIFQIRPPRADDFPKIVQSAPFPSTTESVTFASTVELPRVRQVRLPAQENVRRFLLKP
jgi:hypothetical protein